MNITRWEIIFGLFEGLLFGYRNYPDLDNNIQSSFSSKEYSEKYPEKNNLKIGVEHYPSDIGLLAFDLTYIDSKGLDTNTVILDEDLENPFIYFFIVTKYYNSFHFIFN